MFKTLSAVLSGLAFALPHSASAATTAEESAADVPEASGDSQTSAETWKSEKRQAALRVQLFLDREGFGPGKIDGRWGGFTQKAAERWNESGKDLKIAITGDGELDLSKIAEIPSSGGMTTIYVPTGQDQAILGPLPDGPEQMAKLKGLPYSSLMELLAEKFHADPDFIREINGLEPGAAIEVGTRIQVPNVAEPFDIAEPIQLAKVTAEEKAAEAEAGESGEAAGDETEQPGSDLELTVLRDQRVVEVREAGKLIHSFPISPGANDNRSPAGEWKVSVVSWMPEFRWDKSMLEDGERSGDAHLLPPGPNNPVGIVWIGITADGIGLHGTPFPDAIGRNRSHGCIRLSNWDALTLGKAVTAGTRVIVK